MQVRTAHTAVADLNVDIVLSPFLGLELAPFHLALDRLWGLAQPAFELGRSSHDEVCDVYGGLEGSDLSLVVYKDSEMEGDRVGELVMNSIGNVKTLGT